MSQAMQVTQIMQVMQVIVVKRTVLGHLKLAKISSFCGGTVGAEEEGAWGWVG